MIKWKESYSTGVAKLDEQHKSLFKYCNDLEEALNSGSISKSAIEGSLKFLERYAKGHFGQEEACMHQHACPMAEKNKLAHQQFIETYKALQKKVSEGVDSEGVLKELHSFVENWLTEHIAKVDAKLKPCVR